MLTTNQLKTLQDRSNAAIKTMENAIERLNSAITRHQSDATRSASYIAESIKAERDKVTPALAAELKIIQDTAKEAATQTQFWESRALLMCLQTFNDDPAKDAQIKLAWRAEFTSLPPHPVATGLRECALRRKHTPPVANFQHRASTERRKCRICQRNKHDP